VVLRVGVLGPVLAWNGEQELPVGQPRQQAVLGILAMRANRVISRSELIDAVWGHDAPPSAEGGVYTYIAGLRRIFEPGRSLRGPGRVLVSSGAGYVLHLVPGQPDAVAFEQHLGRARQLRKNGDLAGTLAALDAALGLWRGELAFAGVPGPFAETERARLSELRSAAAEERADVLLAVGRHEEVLADLTAMVVENPLRERMRGLLMLAMYRSGRQAEALRVFAEGRKVLAEELGIDPGAELSRIHQQVLTSDPGLDGPGLQAEASPIFVPAHLPPDAPAFSGRQDELSVLRGLLEATGSVPIAAITGTAGVGKTALAIRFGHQVARQFADGQLYLNLRGFDPALAAVEPAEALRFILQALGVAPHQVPADTDGRTALYRSMVDGKRLLIVLDNAAGAAQVRPLLPGSPSCMVVVTSRNNMAGLVAADGAVPVSLDVLSQGEARELLNRRLGHDRVLADPRASDEIIAACARLPLALSIAVGRAAARPKRSLSEVAAELGEARGGLDALEADDAATDVGAVFSWSYDQLSDGAARMFRLLGVHPGPDISLPAAASLAGVTRQEAAAALRELVRTHMVAEHAQARFTFHDLLRAYAASQAELVESEEEWRASVIRVLDHYLHSAMSASVRYSPFRSPLRLPPPPPGVVPADVSNGEQALAWFEAEIPVLLVLARYAFDNGFDEHAWQLPWTLASYFTRRGHWQEFVASQRTALAAAQRLGDIRALAHAHYEFGHALHLVGETEAADPHVRQALELFRQMGDRASEAVVLHGMGWMLESQGRYPEALTHVLDALRMLRAVGHWWTQASLENTAGWLYARMEQLPQALTHCQRALGLHREAGNPGGVADSLHSIGFVYFKLGDYAKSKTHYEQALEDYREVGSPFGEAESMAGLGDIMVAEGDADGARTRWLDAVVILDQLSHPMAGEVHAKIAALDSHAEPDRLPRTSRAVSAGR
jgi:DNA-binding SARP family transcriptional activator